MLCYILAQYAPQVHENILLFFRHKKQSHRNCCRILNNLQIHIQQVVDASNPDQASANPIPASCRCFRPQDMHLQIQFQQIADASDPRICIYKSNSSKLQMLPNPGYASTNPIPANCRCFQPRPGICKSNSNKLQMLPTPTRHLQIQFQQVADASNPNQASTNPIPANCRCFRPQDMYLQIHIQQIADASDPDQASANPIPANCRCFQPQPGICKSNSSKLQMLPTPTRHLQIQFQQVADASDPGQASANPIPASCRCFRP